MEDTLKFGMFDKIRLFFATKNAWEKFLAGPKSSFLSGSFWAKACAGAVVLWEGFHGYVPHPYDVYITVGLACWAALESYYLKKNHMQTLVDLSRAPQFDPNQFAQTIAAIATKYPGFSPAVGPVTAAVTEIVKETSTVVTSEPEKN